MSFDEPKLAAGTPRLFAERTNRSPLKLDKHGFLLRTKRHFEAERLLQTSCSLIVAPPWTGKTFTAESIFGGVSQEDWPHRWLTSFEKVSVRSLPPGWWGEWREGSAAALWIIDALDEGQRTDPLAWKTLFPILDALSDAERRRLRLLLFGRESDLREHIPNLEGDLRRLFADSFWSVELLPLDADNARNCVLDWANNDQSAFSRVCTLIEQNSLGASGIASYPAALRQLAKTQAGTKTSERRIWESVLRNLVEELRQPRHLRTEPEDRFEAAQRIAAALTLSSQERLGGPGSGSPALEDILSHRSNPNQPTRTAGREALLCLMFRTLPDGSRQFLHRNVREWMAAFALSRHSLQRLRPVLQGEAPTHELPATIRTEYLDLARLLAKVSESSEVQGWLRHALRGAPSDLFTPNPNDARALLDRLEQLADRGAKLTWTEDPIALDRVAAAGAGEEIARRLRDADRSPAARLALLQLGAGPVRPLPEVIDAAATIVRDPSQDDELRSWCASAVARSGSRDLLQSLVPYIETATPSTRKEKAAISSLLAGLVEQRVWNAVRAFEFIPDGPAGPIVDSSHLLPLTLEEHMSEEDATEIVANLGRHQIKSLIDELADAERKSELAVHPRWDALAAAVRKLALARPVDAERLRLLHPFVFSPGRVTDRWEHQLRSELVQSYEVSEAGRRELFEAMVNEGGRGDGADTDHHQWWWIDGLLKTEDLPWLAEHIHAFSAKYPRVWHTALRLSGQTSDEALARETRRTAEEHAPEAVASHEEVRAQLEEWQRESQARQKQQEEARQPIAELSRQILANPDLTLQRQLWNLSWISFSRGTFRPRNLVGSWGDLPEDLRAEILATCATALDEVTPTTIPEGRSFPTALQWEAQAFVQVRRLAPERLPLTEEHIERWLPAVLKTFNEEKFAVLAESMAVAQGAAERVMLEAIERELREESAYSILLQDLPAELWSESVTCWVAEKVRGALSGEARSGLLRFLAARRPDVGLKQAREIIGQRTGEKVIGFDSDRPEGELDDLGVQALSVLLALAPAEAWPLVEDAASLAGPRFFELMLGFTHWAREELAIDWREWPIERIARLAKLLFEAYPPELDPAIEESALRSLGPDDDFRELRWRTLGHLAELEDPSAAAILETAKEIHPDAREWLESLRASREADALVRTGPAMSQPSPGGALAVNEACRLLDDEDFRLIRSDDDLLEVVLEDLARIEKDIGHDLDLLYFPREKGEPERRQNEAALQVYLRRRLEDRLRGKVLDRETLVKWNKRTDIRVIAPVLGLPEDPARVVIEVKWSDNKDISTALSKQLGRDYLLANGLRHGIYLVGWNGHLGIWRRSSGPRPRNTPEALAEALQRQANGFREEHPEVDIRPLVWDLRRSR